MSRMAGNDILAYYQEIENGTAVVNEYIRALYTKIVEGIEDGTYHFDQVKADNAIRFIEKFCHHNKGKLAPGRLTLQLWQKAMLSVIFGIVDANGLREFSEVFIVLGRKQGKTLLASAILAYMLYATPEYGQENYCIAPKLDQSELVFSAFEFTVDHEPALAKITQKRGRKNDIFVARSNSSVKKIAFNEKKADGYSPYLTIADEMSSWPPAKGLRQYEVMTSGTGARDEPLTLSISSGGYVNDGIYDELFKRGTAFLQGNGREKHLLPFLYCIDNPAKWDDINELRKAMPGLGTSVSVKFILEQIDIAYGSLSKKAEFLTKYACLKQSSSQAWLPELAVESACGKALRLEDFRRCYCVGGIDLSMTTDLTSCCIVIERGGKFFVFSHFFLPEAKLEEATARDGLPYDIYRQRGLLSLSEGNVVDYHQVFDWFKAMIEKYQIYPLWVGYDRYSASYLTQEMEQYGFHMDSVYQGENLTGVINDTEGIIRDGKMCIGDNDLLKVHLLDAAMKRNTESNRRKLVKMRAAAHVDGVAALLDAMCMRAAHHSEIGAQLQNKERG